MHGKSTNKRGVQFQGQCMGNGKVYSMFMWLETLDGHSMFHVVGQPPGSWRHDLVDSIRYSYAPNLKRTSMSILSQDFELMPRETRIQGLARCSSAFHGIFSQIASGGCRSPSFQCDTGEQCLICVLCASNSHIVQLTKETVSTLGLDLSRMSCSRALFGFSVRIRVMVTGSGRGFTSSFTTNRCSCTRGRKEERGWSPSQCA